MVVVVCSLWLVLLVVYLWAFACMLHGHSGVQPVADPVSCAREGACPLVFRSECPSTCVRWSVHACLYASACWLQQLVISMTTRPRGRMIC